MFTFGGGVPQAQRNTQGICLCCQGQSTLFPQSPSKVRSSGLGRDFPTWLFVSWHPLFGCVFFGKPVQKETRPCGKKHRINAIKRCPGFPTSRALAVSSSPSWLPPGGQADTQTRPLAEPGSRQGPHETDRRTRRASERLLLNLLGGLVVYHEPRMDKDSELVVADAPRSSIRRL